MNDGFSNYFNFWLPSTILEKIFKYKLDFNKEIVIDEVLKHYVTSYDFFCNYDKLHLKYYHVLNTKYNDNLLKLNISIIHYLKIEKLQHNTLMSYKLNSTETVKDVFDKIQNTFRDKYLNYTIEDLKNKTLIKDPEIVFYIFIDNYLTSYNYIINYLKSETVKYSKMGISEFDIPVIKYFKEKIYVFINEEEYKNYLEKVRGSNSIEEDKIIEKYYKKHYDFEIDNSISSKSKPKSDLNKKIKAVILYIMLKKTGSDLDFSSHKVDIVKFFQEITTIEIDKDTFATDWYKQFELELKKEDKDFIINYFKEKMKVKRSTHTINKILK